MVAQNKHNGLAELDILIKPVMDLLQLQADIEAFFRLVEVGKITVEKRLGESEYFLRELESGEAHEEDYVASLYRKLSAAYKVRLESIRNNARRTYSM